MIVRKEESKVIWTIAELLKWTEGHFKKLGLPTPRLDAEVLLALVLGKSRLELYTGYHMLVEPEERSRFRALVERRSRREPVAYITGKKEFFSLSFEVSPAVLIPRPESEHVVEAALEALRAREGTGLPGPGAVGPTDLPAAADSLPRLRVLDLGTGSGCLAVAVAVNAPGVLVVATDLSPQALEVARRNVVAHGVQDRVSLVAADLTRGLPPGVDPGFDVILSNPPYISRLEFDGLMEDVRLHEPRLALLDTQGPSGDGLGFYRAIAATAGSWLAPGGTVVLEVGAGQAEGVSGLLRSRGLASVSSRKDLGGIERVVVAQR